MQAYGASLVAISPQLPDKSLETAEKNALTFEVLSDVQHHVARQFRLVFAVADELRPVYPKVGADLPAYNGDESWELPVPGIFVVAQDGTVRLASIDADYTRRLEPAAIIACLREIAGK